MAVCRAEAAAAGARPRAPTRWSPLDADDVDRAGRRAAEALDGPVDVVLDPVFGVGGRPRPAGRCAPGGRLVNLGGSAGDAAAFSSSAVLRGRSPRVLGYTNNALTAEQRAEALTSVLALAADGRVSVEHHVRPLAEVAAAWTDVATGAVRQVLVP